MAAAPERGTIRDSRGLARALTGDVEGAKEDFRYFIDWLEENPRLDSRKLQEQRREWIEQLEAGDNPFTPQKLEELRRGQ